MKSFCCADLEPEMVTERCGKPASHWVLIQFYDESVAIGFLMKIQDDLYQWFIEGEPQYRNVGASLKGESTANNVVVRWMPLPQFDD